MDTPAKEIFDECKEIVLQSTMTLVLYVVIVFALLALIAYCIYSIITIINLHTRQKQVFNLWKTPTGNIWKARDDNESFTEQSSTLDTVYDAKHRFETNIKTNIDSFQMYNKKLKQHYAENEMGVAPIIDKTIFDSSKDNY